MTDSTQTDQQSAAATPVTAGRWTRWLATVSFMVAGIYLVSAGIQGSMKVASWIGWAWLPGGLALIGLVALLSRFPIPLWLIGLGGLGLAVAWGLIAQGEPASDFADFYETSVAFAESPSIAVLHSSKSPTSILVYGSWMGVLGESVTTAQLVGAIAHGVAVMSIGTIVGMFGYGGQIARFAALLFALSPGAVTYSSVISYEAILLLTAMPGLVLLVKALQSEQLRVGWFIGAGLLLGLSYLATPAGGFLAIGAGVFALFRLIDRRDRISLIACVSLVTAMALSPLAQTAMNVVFDGRWSPTTSSNAAMGILNGTSIECHGRWCPADLELAGFLGEDALPFDEASERALEIAVDRWTENPIQLLVFSATTKVQQMWSYESHMLNWALRGSPHLEDWEESGSLHWLERLVDSYYLASLVLLVMAVPVVWRLRKLPTEAAVIAIGLVGIAGIHFLMVVQQRYHLIFLPFVFGLISIAIFGGNQSEPEGRSAGSAGEGYVGEPISSGES